MEKQRIFSEFKIYSKNYVLQLVFMIVAVSFFSFFIVYILGIKTVWIRVAFNMIFLLIFNFFAVKYNLFNRVYQRLIIFKNKVEVKE